MSVALHVSAKSYEVGSASFFTCFFSTIVTRLENGNWAAKYPVVMKSLYSGTVPVAQCRAALEELRAIQTAFSSLPPSAVVWDHVRPEAQPPWGGNISPHITSLGNYFSTSSGRDLFSVFEEAFNEAVRAGAAVTVQ